MSYDYRNASIYAAAFQAFKINIWNALGFAVALILIEWLGVVMDNSFAKWIAPVVLTAFFAFLIHATIIFNLDGARKTWSVEYVGCLTSDRGITPIQKLRNAA